ncbi:MAG: hypothetical protein JSW55_10825 [Chloroflexota bacterium]|nr:MAG: hypothetical protein JSW55_10825 [Chloroflexota bacterium]
MSYFGELKIWGQFLWGLHSFLRETISLNDAREIVQRRQEQREANFLSWVEQGIYGFARSPYLPMLKLAGCELGDIRNMVQDKGLNKTLMALREADVYVSFEEYKGRKPIVRDGTVLPVEVGDFDNPYVHNYYRGETGGTTGPATRVLIDLDHLAAQAPVIMLGREANDLLGVPSAVWLDILPDVAGIMNILRPARFGEVPTKWFSPDMIRESSASMSAKFRLATYSMIGVGRLSGTAIPWSERVTLDEPLKIAQWMDEMLKAHGACLLYTHVSKALRVCIAAREAGLDLTGAAVMAGGEPPTETKVREITSTGARWIPIYPFSEYGTVGIGCANPVDENDLHLLDDGLALIQYPRQMPGSTLMVDAFNYTTLLPTAPKLFLNVESDDYGIIEQRSCGCLLETYGYPYHLRQVRSFSKLTSEAGTLIGSEMIRILEEVLPARFGGSALDYQLLEEEDEQGFTRLSLLVHPDIQVDDEEAVIESVLDALQPNSAGPGQGSLAAEMTRSTWKQANTLRIKRQAPILTAHGKMMPLYVAPKNLDPQQ